ncbi:MAG: sulfotransferase family protein [Acidimicrobiales bacterium]
MRKLPAKRPAFDPGAWLAEHAPPPKQRGTVRVQAHDVEASPVRGRLVVVWAPEPVHGALRGRLKAQGLAVLDPGTNLFTSGALTLFVNHHWVTQMGTAKMVESPFFAGALRRLLDRLLCEAWSSASTSAPASEAVLVEVVDPNDLSRQMVEDLYPDALQVDERDIERIGTGPRPSAAPPEGAPWAFPPPPRRVLVVLGAPRSGTTWLSRLLQLHPCAGGIGDEETWLFQELRHLWHDEGLRAHVRPHELAEALRAFCDELFGATLARGAEAPDAVPVMFVEKTPIHVYEVQMIEALYPEARFVHIVRDGRDVARSLSHMPMASFPSPAQCIREWARMVDAARTAAGAAHFMEIRYEDMVVDPVGTVGAVLEWAGLPVDDPTREALRDAAGERVSTWAGTDSAVGTGTWATMSTLALGQIYAAGGEVLVRERYVDDAELRAWRRRPSYVLARLTESASKIRARLGPGRTRPGS